MDVEAEQQRRGRKSIDAFELCSLRRILCTAGQTDKKLQSRLKLFYLGLIAGRSSALEKTTILRKGEETGQLDSNITAETTHLYMVYMVTSCGQDQVTPYNPYSQVDAIIFIYLDSFVQSNLQVRTREQG